MDEEFEKETERLLQEALEEFEDDDGDNGEETDESGDESIKSGESESDEESEENNSGTSGDGDEDEHQGDDEEDVKSDFEPIEVEVSGHKVTINSKEEMLAYIKAGASSFSKEPEKFTEEKTIISQAGLSADDLKLIAEAKAGSKEAIALIAKRAGVDILDVENEMAESYKQQKEYYQPSEVDQVADEILKDEVHASEFRRISGTLPQDFMQEITSNARDLKAFSNHIKNGIAQKVIPLAINSQIVNGGTFLENYNKVGFEMSQQTKQPEQKREIGEREKELRKRASSGRGNNHQSQSTSDKDIWDMSDEDFDKLDLSTLK